MPEGGAPRSAEESNRAAELTRSHAASRRAASDGFMSSLANSARGLVLTGSLMGGMQPRDSDSGPSASGDRTEQVQVDEDEEMTPMEQLSRSRASVGRAQAVAEAQEAIGEADTQIQEQTNSVNFYILQFTTDLISFDVSCFGLTLPITLPLYDILIVPILGYELYNAWTGNPSLIPYFPKLSWQSFLKPGGGGKTPPIPLPDTPLYVLVFAVILFLGLLTFIEAGFIAAVLYAWNNPTEAGSMLSGFLGLPSIPGL